MHEAVHDDAEPKRPATNEYGTDYSHKWINIIIVGRIRLDARRVRALLPIWPSSATTRKMRCAAEWKREKPIKP